jgi:uncharacterized membrane protein
MRFLHGLLYLVVGLVGLYWSIELTLIGMYGVPFSWWYAAIALGGIVLILGAICVWATTQAWAEWVSFVGSLILAAYFVPAIIVTAYRCIMGQTPVGIELLIRVIVVALVVFCFNVAVNKTLGRVAQIRCSRSLGWLFRSRL